MNNAELFIRMYNDRKKKNDACLVVSLPFHKDCLADDEMLVAVHGYNPWDDTYYKVLKKINTETQPRVLYPVYHLDPLFIIFKEGGNK